MHKPNNCLVGQITFVTLLVKAEKCFLELIPGLAASFPKFRWACKDRASKAEIIYIKCN